MSFKIVFIAICALLIMSCNKDNGPYYGGAKVTATVTSFPSDQGNKWSYYTRADFNIPKKDSGKTEYNIAWENAGDTIINGLLCFKINKTVIDVSNGQTSFGCDYFRNDSTGVYCDASLHSPGVIFLKRSNLSKIPPSFLFEHTGIGSTPYTAGVSIIQPPLYLLKFPVKLNELWTSNEFGSKGLTKRVWLTDTAIQVPAGSFTCKKMQIILYNAQALVPDTTAPKIFQYFSDKGLIMEERFSDKLIFSDGSKGSFKETTKLTSINF